MGEFIPVLVAAFIVLIAMYGLVVVLPDIHLSSPSGKVLAVAEDRYMHTMLAEDKWVSSSLVSLGETEGTVKDDFNGEEKGLLLPFGTEADWFEKGLIEFVVGKGEGDLVMTMNGDEFYRKNTKPGKHYAYFDKQSLTGDDFLEIRASRGFAFWDSAYYKVKAEVKGEIISEVNTSFLAPIKYKKAKLFASFVENNGKLTIKVNEQIVYEGEPDGTVNIDLGRLRKSNRVVFLPDIGAKHLIDWAEIRFEK